MSAAAPGGVSLRAAYRIAERDLLSQLRSRSFLVQTLLLPMLLTGIIGAALGGRQASEPVPVALVAEDNAITRGLAGALEAGGLADVQHMSARDAERGVLAGTLVASIELPADLSRAARSAAAPPAHIRLVTDPASRVRTLIIEEITRSYFSQLEAGRAAVLGAVQALKPPDAPSLGRAAARAQASVEASTADSLVSFDARLASGQSAGYFAYYAVAFGVMFTLLSAALGAGGLLEESARGTLVRLLAAPLNAATLILGKFAALFAVAVVQLTLFVLATFVAYGVNWGAPGPVALGVIATAAAAAGVGGVVIGLARSAEQVSTYALLLVLLMSLMGGSMWPVETLPDPMGTLSRFTFNRWAIEAFQLVSVPGLSLADAAPALAVLAGIGVAGFVFGSVRLARRYQP